MTLHPKAKMKLTAYCNYAHRSLQLAALGAPERIKADDVVKVHGLARPHIVNILHELGRAAYLETHRGRGGGFRLSERPLELVEWFNPERNTRPLIGICKLARALREATTALMAVLDDLMLTKIASNRSELLSRFMPIEEGIVAPMRRAR